MDKSFFVVVGLLVGIIAGLAVDMTLNSGKAAAQHLHHTFPECSSACHG